MWLTWKMTVEREGGRGRARGRSRGRGREVAVFITLDYTRSWGTGIRGLMRGMATLLQGIQELLVVRDKVGRPPGELGVGKSMESDIFPSMF